MKTLFQIQTESGQLWLDIKEHLDALAAEVTEAKAAILALETALDADDLPTAKSELAKTKRTARQKERAELQSQKQAIEDRIAALKD